MLASAAEPSEAEVLQQVAPAGGMLWPEFRHTACETGPRAEVSLPPVFAESTALAVKPLPAAWRTDRWRAPVVAVATVTVGPTGAFGRPGTQQVLVALVARSPTDRARAALPALVAQRELSEYTTAVRNQILVPDQGAGVESGIHQQMTATDGVYSQLFTIRASGYTTPAGRA